MASPEFKAERLSQTLQRIVNASRCVTNATETIAEARCWAQMSYYLTSPDMSDDMVALERQEKLRLSQATKKEFRLGNSDDPWVMFERAGREISWSIVLPLLHPDHPKTFEK
jgi:hypothetical protein